MNRVLHITPHLGGGVGRALAGMVAAQKQHHSAWKHEICCLEVPEKVVAADELIALGCGVHIAPDDSFLDQKINEADIVQIEWWQHPALYQRLCNRPLPSMRLLTWVHVNGLSTPLIPPGIVHASHIIAFTSASTLSCPNLQSVLNKTEKATVINSCAGFPQIEPVNRSANEPLKAGYLGSLNFSKLNPDFVAYLAAIEDTIFSIDIYADRLHLELLQEQAKECGRPQLLNFLGYTADPVGALARMNVMPYLLNPHHYGTTENALLEAMASAVVPVVLDHPVEKIIVQDQVTGLVVSNSRQFAQAMEYLNANPGQRVKLGQAASDWVRRNFSSPGISAKFDQAFSSLMNRDKSIIDFTGALGTSSTEWFLAGQSDPDIFLNNKPLPSSKSDKRPTFFEKTKGSVQHFSQTFPHNDDLKKWAQRIQRMDMKFFPCSVCQSPNDDNLLEMETGNLDGSTLYSTVRLACCQQCGHVYNNITEDELNGLYQYYNEEYAPINLKASGSKGDRPGSADSLTSARYLQMYGFVEEYLKPDHRVLDVGCAVGGFLQFLKTKGFHDLAGVDMANNYVEQARKNTGCTVEHGQAESLPFEEDQFDFLVLEQVMEHLINPGLAFREAARVMRKNGILCIGVPDAARYSDEPYFDYYWVLLREHIQHFDTPHLKQLAQNEGFELLSSHQTNHDVMSDKMVMPTLYGIFRLTGQPSTQNTSGSNSQELKQTMAHYLAQQAQLLSRRQTTLEEFSVNQKPVYAWGIGREFEYLHESTKLSQCNLKGLIDLNTLKQATHTIAGMSIGPAQILKDAPDDSVLLVTAVAHTEAVVDSALALGFKGQIITLIDNGVNSPT